jgi:hypothetical protein
VKVRWKGCTHALPQVSVTAMYWKSASSLVRGHCKPSISSAESGVGMVCGRDGKQGSTSPAAPAGLAPPAGPAPPVGAALSTGE